VMPVLACGPFVVLPIHYLTDYLCLFLASAGFLVPGVVFSLCFLVLAACLPWVV